MDPDFRFAARFSREIIHYIKRNGLKNGTALNINIPAVPPEKIKGVSVTRQGVCRYRERFERRVDPRGNVYYWLTGEIPIEEKAPQTDNALLEDHRITITPIKYDLTCDDELKRLSASSRPNIKKVQ